MRMRNDNVLIQKLELPDQTQSGLVLPKTRRSRQDGIAVGIVVASGPGWRLRNGRGPVEANEVAEGDIVLYPDGAGDRAQDFGMDNQDERQNHGADFGDRVILRHEQILAVVDGIESQEDMAALIESTLEYD